MKKLLKFLMVAMLFFALATPALAAYVHFEIDVYRDKGFRTTAGGYGDAITTGITYKVLDDDTDTASTIYSDEGVTSKDNFITTTVFAVDDQIDFYISGTTATVVDIIVVDTIGGYTLFLDDVATNTTYCIIDERPGIQHHGIIWWGVTTSSDVDGTDIDTGIDFDVGTLIHNVIVELITPTISSYLLDVGILSTATSGTVNAFINDMDLSGLGAGWYDPFKVGISSGGAVDIIVNATHGVPLGDFLGHIDEGTTSDASGDVGLWVKFDCPINSNNQHFVYAISSLGADATATGAAGYLHYLFTRPKWSESELRTYP